jgi:putative oxidoreductase
VLGGLLLLFGFFVPLALTLLAAELYNILAFHLTMAPGSIAPALVACVLWILVFLQYRESFNGIFSAKPATQPITKWRTGTSTSRVFCSQIKSVREHWPT